MFTYVRYACSSESIEDTAMDDSVTFAGIGGKYFL